MEHGWQNVTVEDIAAAANVSPRTFRNYFATKAEAVAAGHLERMLCIADSLGARPLDEDIWTALTNAVAAQFEPPGHKGRSAAELKKWWKSIRFLLTEPAIRGEVLKVAAIAQNELAQAVAKRIGTKRKGDLYPELIAAVVIAVVGVVQDRWLHDGPTEPIIPFLRSAFAQVAAGLPDKTPAGQRS
jgi:AcrR family transcriptional regulator